MAGGRLPESGPDLCSQPALCPLERLPRVTGRKRMLAAMVGLFGDSFGEVPRRLVPDIDAPEGRVQGGQQVAVFPAPYGGRWFLPIPVYEATAGKPVAA